ncbi:hypothetical protein CC86DRAFT_195734 [Ophiobolus disseminans]|uniref:Uncharacterized protein n=1 Tax=Ophiobolus disseminans TaxID=1469910 RepID=A0A6A7A5P4_9PLEO|nr:hypothetical protein CC86DRAFT_195734 [Ophiobolus disseminans]
MPPQQVNRDPQSRLRRIYVFASEMTKVGHNFEHYDRGTGQVLAHRELISDVPHRQSICSRTVIAMPSSQRPSAADMHPICSLTREVAGGQQTTVSPSIDLCSFLIHAQLRLGSSGAHPRVFAKQLKLAQHFLHKSDGRFAHADRTWRKAPIPKGKRQGRAPCQSWPWWHVACGGAGEK